MITALLFTILNAFCCAMNYEMKNYKTAIFNGFATGICLMALITKLC